jgi:serine/threonine protein kinase
MSPEQWGNAVTVGPASDLYSLAVVAFEALTGRRPFQAATMSECAELHRRGKVPAVGGTLPPALDRMFERALAKRPADRWGTALELAGALRAVSGVGSGKTGGGRKGSCGAAPPSQISSTGPATRPARRPSMISRRRSSQRAGAPPGAPGGSGACWSGAPC